MTESPPTAAVELIFEELRYYEDRARSDEEIRDGRLASLITLSGAVLALLAASLPSSLCGTAIVLLSVAGGSFALAILVATQFVVRFSLFAQFFGGRLERVPEVGLQEFGNYLTSSYQEADPVVLRGRVLPVMNAAIGTRRRNAARKERCQDVAIFLVALGLAAATAYAVILTV
jgi:hypothetical protein